MFRSRSLWLASLALTALVLGALAVLTPSRPVAQASPTVGLRTNSASGLLDAANDTIELQTGGLASLGIQALDSYTGVWEVQCSMDGGTTYDTDDEVLLTLVGATSTAAEVTDTVGVWQANVSGCNSVRVFATAWTAGDVTIRLQAISSGGSGGGGGSGGSGDTELPNAAALADATANPTVPGVGAFLMCWNGTTWDRCQSTRDPCDGAAKTTLAGVITTATTTELTAALAGASTHYYVCSANVGPVAGAQTFALTDDDTDNCASVTSGLAGGTTAANGWNFAANGGLTFGNGMGTIAKTNGTNRVLCAVTGQAVVTPYVLTVVAAP